MRVLETNLAGVLLIEPQVFGDERGFFMESYSQSRYAQAGMPEAFVQDNVSSSGHGILRGLHLQHPQGQGKLCTVLDGEVFDVAVDVRIGSPSFGKWEGFDLSSENKRQLYIPPGFAHGFCVTGERALFSYKCTELYSAQNEFGVAWNDPAIGIEWPIAEPVLSDKDLAHQSLSDIPRDRLPTYD